ncbi:MAG: hypothetical protein JXQ72_11435 [Anaerolineae bacterium]|nr:hypothetical protein [Anaerolineae bacterium]
MSISVAWDNSEKTAIRYDFDPMWTWQDFVAATQEDDALFDSVDHTVHLVLNMQQIKTFPSNPLQHLKRLSGHLNPQLGLIVCVGNNAWATKVLEIFYKVYGQRAEGLTGVESVHTLDEARQIIANYDQEVS